MDYDGMRKASQQKRAKNRASSLDYLRGCGFHPEVKNGGAHLIIRVGDDRWDLWPGTGLWVENGNHKRQRRGVKKLAKRLRVARDELIKRTPGNQYAECLACEQVDVLVPETMMCGPCTFGEAATRGGNW